MKVCPPQAGLHGDTGHTEDAPVPPMLLTAEQIDRSGYVHSRSSGYCLRPLKLIKIASEIPH
jgi:hypothetical protein